MYEPRYDQRCVESGSPLPSNRAGRARPEDSHTRRLLDGAPIKPAKKLGEEAVEVAIAALAQDKKALVAETADLLYHLLVVLESRRVAA